jgi:hypothetical protein
MIFSINVHENLPFLLKQIDNIQEHVAEPHLIILSCNEYMYIALQDIALPSNVIVNPEVINKKTFHGSLTHGIYSNMKLALNRFPFSYFIVLSSRTFFYNNLTVSWLNSNQPLCSDLNVYRKFVIQSDDYTDWDQVILKGKYYEKKVPPDEQYKDWFWSTFVHTDIAKYFMNKKLKLYVSPHEGLVFHYQVCKNIEHFLEKHPSIQTNIFTFPHCIEEFSLQTISMNIINLHHPYFGFIYIGNGVHEEIHNHNAFVYKIARQ